MKKTLIALMVALVLAAPAQALDGFTRSARLEQITDWLAQRPTEVWCPNDTAAWDAFEASVGHPEGLNGWARYGGPDIYLAPWVCADLLGPPRATRAYAASLLTLTHEPMHTRGERDESVADCAALNYIDNVAWRLGVRLGIRMYLLTQFAWERHRGKPPEYTRYCMTTKNGPAVQ